MWQIIYKTQEQLNNLKESWKYLTEMLYLLYKKAQPWVNWLDLENIAQEYIDKHNLKWAFKWYSWFPTNICFSVNECVVHWIPSNYTLKEWDLLKIDAWINYKWMVSDAAFSKVIWWDNYNPLWAKLIKATKQALDEWIKTLKIWENFYKLWKTIFNTIRKQWFSIIRNLTWHWVWVKVHEPPNIYNYPHKDLKNIILKKWMSFAIEPITAIQSTEFIEKRKWWWDLLCKKWDLWAHWEYTIITIDNKIEIVAWLQDNSY